jgi:hypothetical protein
VSFRRSRLYINRAPIEYDFQQRHQSTAESSTETNIASIAIRIIATQTDNMSKLINRTTLFKLDGAENQAKLLAAYEKLAKEQNKVSRVVNET